MTAVQNKRETERHTHTAGNERNEWMAHMRNSLAHYWNLSIFLVAVRIRRLAVVTRSPRSLSRPRTRRPAWCGCVRARAPPIHSFWWFFFSLFYRQRRAHYNFCIMGPMRPEWNWIRTFASQFNWWYSANSMKYFLSICLPCLPTFPRFLSFYEVCLSFSFYSSGSIENSAPCKLSSDNKRRKKMLYRIHARRIRGCGHRQMDSMLTLDMVAEFVSNLFSLSNERKKNMNIESARVRHGVSIAFNQSKEKKKSLLWSASLVPRYSRFTHSWERKKTGPRKQWKSYTELRRTWHTNTSCTHRFTLAHDLVQQIVFIEFL